MGVVYEALDKDRDTRVALKTLHNVSAENLYRLKQEFRALQDLDHPNLVSLGELFEESGQWFYTMELLDGVDFLSYVWGRQEGDEDALAPPVPDLARLRDAIRQLARGLVALHDAGKVHRDIKPSNIRVTSSGRVALLDFGLIAEHERPLDSWEHDVVGTVAYMAPEQAASRPLGPEADWYSVGAVLYQALTGSLPFDGTLVEVFLDKQRKDPRSPSSLAAAEVPDDLDELCMELLRRTPEARPVGTEVLRRLGVAPEASGPIAVPTRAAEAGLFVGRLAEVDAMRAAFDSTLRGSAAVVYVHGDSGVGKSALVSHLTAEIADELEDVVVLAGRCYERESVPYKAFDGVIDELTRYLRHLPADELQALLPDDAPLLPRLFPVIGRVAQIADDEFDAEPRVDPVDLRHRVFGALRVLFDRLAKRHRLIIVIDDHQWADADSALLLAELLREPGAPPMLLMISSRSEPGENEWLPSDAVVLSVKPLEPEEARKLARLLLARVDLKSKVSPTTIAMEAQGHPLYINELVRHAEIATDEQRRRPRLEEAIRDRVANLEEPVQRVLEVLAIAAAPLPESVLRAATHLDATSLERAISQLRFTHLARGGLGRSLEPYHDRVRKAVARQLEEAARNDLHVEVARALEVTEAAQERPELLIYHLATAGKSKQAAIYAAQAAARAARAFAFGQAAELYSVAIEHGEYDEDTKRELRIAQANALANSGRGRAAASVFLTVADGADPTTRMICRQRAAEQLLYSGHIERGLETLEALLEGTGVSVHVTPKRALASLLYQRAKLRLRGLRWRERDESDIPETDLVLADVYQAVGEALGLVDSIRGADFQVRSLLCALRTGERGRVARAIATEGVFAASQGGRGVLRGERLIEEASRIAAGLDNPIVAARVNTADGMVSYLSGRLGEAADRLQRAEQRFRGRFGSTWELNSARLFWLFTSRWMGAIDERLRVFESYALDAAQRGDLYTETSMRLSNNFLWLASGLPERAERDLESTTWSPPEGGYHLQHWWELEARTELALYRQRVPSDIEGLRHGFDGLSGSLLLRIQFVRANSRWVWGRLNLALARGESEPRAALAEARRAGKRLLSEGVGYAKAWGLLLFAGVAAQTTDDKTVDLLSSAIAVAEKADMPLLAEAARVRLGERIGERTGATLAAEAREWMREQGVTEPARLADVLVPGFPGDTSSP